MAYKTLDIYRKMAYPIRYDIGFCDIAYITLQSLPGIAITRIRYHRFRVRIKGNVYILTLLLCQVTRGFLITKNLKMRGKKKNGRSKQNRFVGLRRL